MLLTSSVICNQSLLYGNKIVQYLQSYKCKGINQKHFKKSFRRSYKRYGNNYPKLAKLPYPKIWSKANNFSQNYLPANLIFRFIDSYFILTQRRRKWQYYYEYQFLKQTSKLIFTWKFEVFVSIYCKIVALSVFNKICQKFIFFNRCFITPHTPALCFN